MLIISGILLIIGLWTPIAGTLVTVLELLNLLHSPETWLYLGLGILASAIAMVGPGGWSLDARLFGWKRLEVPARAIDPPKSHPME